MKKLDHIIDIFLLGIILFLTIAIPLSVLIQYLGLYFQISAWHQLSFGIVLWITLPCLIGIYIYKMIRKRHTFSKYDIFIFLFIILSILSTIFALNQHTSFFGEKNRQEGLLSILTYFFLFLNMKSFNNKKMVSIFIHIFLFIGLLQVGIAFEQVFYRSPQLPFFQYPYMAMGLCVNPNFFGSYMIILLLLSLGLYLFSPKHNKLYFVLMLFYYCGIILSQTTGVFLSLIVTMIAAAFFFWKKGQKIGKKLTLIGGCFLVLFIGISNSAEYVSVNWYHNRLEANYLIKGDLLLFLSFGNQERYNKMLENHSLHHDKDKPLSESAGSGRFTIWKNSIEMIPTYFWIGSGLDNFRGAYARHTEEYSIDKAHNQYLQLAITQGVPYLLIYIIFLFFIFKESIKSNQKEVWIYLLPFVGYSIQIFMNISVIQVAPFYYILLGLLVSTFSEDRFTFSKKHV